jgi:hypothetical protein
MTAASNVGDPDELKAAVIGRKIASVDGQTITLDDGTKVELVGYGDCCAYADVAALLLHPEKIDHAITGVRLGETGDEGYGEEVWHVFADMGDVLDVRLGYSEGSGYYSFGIEVRVQR